MLGQIFTSNDYPGVPYFKRGTARRRGCATRCGRKRSRIVGVKIDHRVFNLIFKTGDFNGMLGRCQTLEQSLLLFRDGFYLSCRMALRLSDLRFCEPLWFGADFMPDTASLFRPTTFQIYRRQEEGVPDVRQWACKLNPDQKLSSRYNSFRIPRHSWYCSSSVPDRWYRESSRVISVGRISLVKPTLISSRY